MYKAKEHSTEISEIHYSLSKLWAGMFVILLFFLISLLPMAISELKIASITKHYLTFIVFSIIFFLLDPLTEFFEYMNNKTSKSSNNTSNVDTNNTSKLPPKIRSNLIRMLAILIVIIALTMLINKISRPIFTETKFKLPKKIGFRIVTILTRALVSVIYSAILLAAPKLFLVFILLLASILLFCYHRTIANIYL